MHIDGGDVLNVIDEATHMSAAEFLSKRDADSIWNALMSFWCTIYTGASNTIITDHGSPLGQKLIDIVQIQDI